VGREAGNEAPSPGNQISTKVRFWKHDSEMPFQEFVMIPLVLLVISIARGVAAGVLFQVLSLVSGFAALALSVLARSSVVVDQRTSFQNWGRQRNERLQAFAAQLAKSPEAQNRIGFAAALLLALVVFVLAQPAPSDQTARIFNVWETLTTTREIVVNPTRENETATYPAGTTFRVVAQGPKGVVALIGETQEQINLPFDIIKEAGGTSGPTLKTTNEVQSPKSKSTVHWDGPDGIFVGFATGQENIPSSNPDFERKVVALTNIERSKRGLQPLIWDEDLARAARYAAADYYVQDTMSKTHATYDAYISNTGKQTNIYIESPKSRIFKFYGKPGMDKPTVNLGENATKARTPEAAIAAWMASPGHRENILRPHFTKIGVGFIAGSKNESFPIFVQCFAK